MKVAVVIPEHKKNISINENKTIINLEKKLPNIPKYWVSPNGVWNDYILSRWDNKICKCLQFNQWDGTFDGYQKMSINPDFYSLFQMYDYVLIHQTDALILGNEEDLLSFCDMKYDYIGAPFGTSDAQGFWVSRHRFPERYIDYVRKKMGFMKRLTVGNGGICLRRVSSTIRVLDKYKNKIPHWFEDAYEDIVLSWLATYDKNYNAAPVDIAAKFAKDQYMYDITNSPFAVHGKHYISDSFWEGFINEST